MTTISLNEFRRDADAVILKVKQGETVVLTDEGAPVVHMQPVTSESTASQPDAADEPTPLSDLAWMWELGERLVPPGPTTHLTNEEIDRIIYRT
jgi:antitoxin (DNA-binding transcriptional repressor) of toxin-antitoxin stability system